MHEANSWRELLGKRVADTAERQRIATELGVRPITLTRWVGGESAPRFQNLRQLLIALPDYREALILSIEQEFPGFRSGLDEEAAQDVPATIPGEFYMRVLHTRASMSSGLRYPTLCDLILQQALKQLDPQRSGLGVSIARCLPPAPGEDVSCLLADMGRGSPPWEQNMERETMLLGAESLAGYAVISSHLVVIADLQKIGLRFPASLGTWERSAAAAPITFEGCFAGSLLVSSTLTDFFLPARQQLIGSYADLLALAFELEQFFPTSRIQLRVMPPQQEQQVHFSRFRALLMETMRRAAEKQQSINVLQAEQLVWQQIASELLQTHVANVHYQEEEFSHGI